MTLSDRIEEVEQKFNTKRAEYDAHIRAADECMVEIHRLEGEHRLLQSIELPSKVDADPATTIEAIPAKENK